MKPRLGVDVLEAGDVVNRQGVREDGVEDGVEDVGRRKGTKPEIVAGVGRSVGEEADAIGSDVVGF